MVTMGLVSWCGSDWECLSGGPWPRLGILLIVVVGSIVWLHVMLLFRAVVAKGRRRVGQTLDRWVLVRAVARVQCLACPAVMRRAWSLFGRRLLIAVAEINIPVAAVVIPGIGRWAPVAWVLGLRRFGDRAVVDSWKTERRRRFSGRTDLGHTAVENAVDLLANCIKFCHLYRQE